VLDAVLTPGDVILMLSWRTLAEAPEFEGRVSQPDNSRRRPIRIIGDYGMYDRREIRSTIHTFRFPASSESQAPAVDDGTGSTTSTRQPPSAW
jgi:hypothetical protein